uniref:Uncharacterized protein n=1 Tax=Apteryx owenii TaxID=8824 RepID=A0A8B9Q5W9_APTOW
MCSACASHVQHMCIARASHVPLHIPVHCTSPVCIPVHRMSPAHVPVHCTSSVHVPPHAHPCALHEPCACVPVCHTPLCTPLC